MQPHPALQQACTQGASEDADADCGHVQTPWRVTVMALLPRGPSLLDNSRHRHARPWSAHGDTSDIPCKTAPCPACTPAANERTINSSWPHHIILAVAWNPAWAVASHLAPLGWRSCMGVSSPARAGLGPCIWDWTMHILSMCLRPGEQSLGGLECHARCHFTMMFSAT